MYALLPKEPKTNLIMGIEKRFSEFRNSFVLTAIGAVHQDSLKYFDKQKP